MAQFVETVDTTYSYNDMVLRDPLVMFEQFVAHKWKQTEFVIDPAEQEPTGAEVKCLLDYLFVWLAEADGALACPTYEIWMITVARFASVMFTESHGLDHDVRGWIRNLRDSAGLTEPLDLMAPGTMTHLAFDRNVYDQCRQSAVWRREYRYREEQRRQLRQDLKKARKK